MQTDKLISRFGIILTVVLSSTLLFTACSDDDNGVTGGTDEPVTIAELAAQDEDLSILSQAIADTDLTAEIISDNRVRTIFAPTDEAFAKLPEGTLQSLTTEQLAEILQFHVVTGRTLSSDLSASQDVNTVLGEEILIESSNGVIINASANVTEANITASNGIIHKIDEVLLPEGYREPNLIDLAKNAGNFETLLGAIEFTGLTTTLKYKETFTAFAPTDDAFAALPQGLIASLSADQLRQILLYHVTSGSADAASLQAEQAVSTLAQGNESASSIYVTKDTEGNVTVNGSSSVVAADVSASNGLIHVIDEVLIPDAFGTVVDAAAKRYMFDTLVDAVVNAGLAGALSNTDANFTVFAPTDAAFAALPDGLLGSLTTEQLAEILQYHVLPVNVASGDLQAEQAPASLTDGEVYVTVEEGSVLVNGSSTVVTADVQTNNGVIHAIDQVILPNKYIDVVDIASKNYRLETLVTLVSDAGLVETLKGSGPFTVFAPTDAAFEEVSSTLSGLTQEQVTEVLTYHAVGAEALSGDLSDGMTISTVQGEDITVNIDAEGNVTLNNSVSVTTVDLQGTNGVVHLIDGVLLPPSYN